MWPPRSATNPSANPWDIYIYMIIYVCMYVYWLSQNFPWFSHIGSWFSTFFHNSIFFNDFLWFSHVVPWFSTNCPWLLRGFYDFQCLPWLCNNCLWISMFFHYCPLFLEQFEVVEPEIDPLQARPASFSSSTLAAMGSVGSTAGVSVCGVERWKDWGVQWKIEEVWGSHGKIIRNFGTV